MSAVKQKKGKLLTKVELSVYEHTTEVKGSGFEKISRARLDRALEEISREAGRVRRALIRESRPVTEREERTDAG